MMNPSLKFFGILGVFALFYSCNSKDTSPNRPITDTIVIQAMKFAPHILTVHKNDTIVWINKGLVDHNITHYPGKNWTSDTIDTEASWKKAITDSFSYFCSIHPVMYGKILLENK